MNLLYEKVYILRYTTQPNKVTEAHSNPQTSAYCKYDTHTLAHAHINTHTFQDGCECELQALTRLHRIEHMEHILNT
jgi:hypothetical protein